MDILSNTPDIQPQNKVDRMKDLTEIKTHKLESTSFTNDRKTETRNKLTIF